MAGKNIFKNQPVAIGSKDYFLYIKDQTYRTNRGIFKN